MRYRLMGVGATVATIAAAVAFVAAQDSSPSTSGGARRNRSGPAATVRASRRRRGRRDRPGADARLGLSRSRAPPESARGRVTVVVSSARLRARPHGRPERRSPTCSARVAIRLRPRKRAGVRSQVAAPRVVRRQNVIQEKSRLGGKVAAFAETTRRCPRKNRHVRLRRVDGETTRDDAPE